MMPDELDHCWIQATLFECVLLNKTMVVDEA